MKRSSSFRAIALAAGLIAGIAATTNAAAEDALLKEARGVFAPLPKDMATKERPVTPALVELGRALFFEPRASIDGTTSCARCHAPQLYGGDALTTSHGNHDRIGTRNAPTVLNTALQVKQHWGGNREDVEDQAVKALTGAGSYGNPNTKKAEDKYVFKVPALRNVAMTGPYFHDGSVASLEAAVRIMAKVQLGAAPDDKAVQDIVAFLGSLTGPVPANYATVPALPAER